MRNYQDASTNWSDDPKDWIQYSSEFATNSEYIDVKLDSSNHILEGIKHDGTKYIAGGLHVDGDIVNQGMKEAFDSKVDKSEGKSLIDANFAESNYVVGSPEYIDVKVDSSNHVLEGIGTNGNKKFNIPVENQSSIIYSAESHDYIKVEIDANNKIINAIKRNGDVIIGGVNINELKRDVDSNIIAIEYDASTYEIYAITGEDSNVSLSMDEEGHIYKETIID